MLNYVLVVNPPENLHRLHRMKKWLTEIEAPDDVAFSIGLDGDVTDTSLEGLSQLAAADGFPHLTDFLDTNFGCESFEKQWCYCRALRWIERNLDSGEHAMILMMHAQLHRPWSDFATAVDALASYDVISFYTFDNAYVPKTVHHPDSQPCVQHPEFRTGTQGYGDEALVFTARGASTFLRLMSRFPTTEPGKVFGYSSLQIAGETHLSLCSPIAPVPPNKPNAWLKPFTMSAIRLREPRQLVPLFEPTSLAFDENASDKQYKHFYGSIYQWLLDSLCLRRNSPLWVLEIGVSLNQPQGSFQVWQAEPLIGLAVGVDIHAYTGTVNPPHEFIQGDAYSPMFLERLRMQFSRGFDLIIDDGSHHWDHQIFFLREYWQICAPGGYLVLEDVASWTVFKEMLQIPNTTLIDLSWNTENQGRTLGFQEMDSKLIIRKC